MPVITLNPILTDSESVTYGLTADHPVIGWHTLVTPTGVTSTSSAAGYPPSNLANPATHLYWKAGAAGSAVAITLSVGPDPINYIAIAGHNLGRTGCIVTILGQTTATPPGFPTIVAGRVLPNDSPALWRFPEQAMPAGNIIFHMQAPTGENLAQQIATIYVGRLLTLPRKIYQGFAPINYSRVAKVTNGRSEAGNFIGRIVLQEFVKDTVPLSLIDPTYFRNHIADFLIDSKENPFFFAWRPETYPDEIGYCHMTNDPAPTNATPHGLISMQMEMTGVI